MLKTIIPKSRYWRADYPNLEEGSDGRVRPILYGEKEGMTPICLNTETGLYEIANHRIKEITEIKAGDTTLVSGTDYTEDLINGQFQLSSTPKISPGNTYYVVIEADNVINGTDYLKVLRYSGNDYADGQAFEIDGADNWTGQSYDLCLRVMAREGSVDGGWNWVLHLPTDWSNVERIGLRDVAARTKMAQSFKLPSWATGDWYITAIEFNLYPEGNPTGSIYFRILSSYTPETQVGIDSNEMIGKIEDTSYIRYPWRRAYFDLRDPQESEISIHAKGKYSAEAGNPLITNIADVVEDIMADELGVSSDALDELAFDDLRTNKTEEISCYLNTEIPFDEFLSVAEAGQDWKLIPGLDRKYSPQWYDPNIPSGETILHLMDEDFVSFRMYRDLEAVKQICRIRYDHSPSGSDSEVSEAENFYPFFFYSIEETIELDAYLKDETEVGLIVADKLERTEEPLLTAVFETKGHGFDLLPFDRIYLTRKRALYENGKLEKVLFRIFKVSKKISEKTTEIVAVLDSQVSI